MLAMVIWWAQEIMLRRQWKAQQLTAQLYAIAMAQQRYAAAVAEQQHMSYCTSLSISYWQLDDKRERQTMCRRFCGHQLDTQKDISASMLQIRSTRLDQLANEASTCAVLTVCME